ncbi:MAG: acyl carrier protein [Clostridia bacterium]|nr:acyl carrier protein [Clostridia bacterium]
MLVLKKLKKILGEQFNVEERTISYGTNFFEDLNADSLDVIDLVSTLSSEFNLDIDESKIAGFKTVGDVVKYIEDNTEKKI